MCTGSFISVFIQVLAEYDHRVDTLEYSSIVKNLQYFLVVHVCDAGDVSLSHVCHGCDV